MCVCVRCGWSAQKCRVARRVRGNAALARQGLQANPASVAPGATCVLPTTHATVYPAPATRMLPAITVCMLWT